LWKVPRTRAVVPRLLFDSSNNVFILENEDGTTSRNISQTKLNNHIEAFERSRKVGQNLAAPPKAEPSEKLKKEVKSFTKFLDDTKEQLAKSKGTLVSSVSSQTLTDELKPTVTESINAVYDQLIAIIDAKKAEIQAVTDVSEQAKLITNDSNWQQQTKNKIKVLEEKFRSLVSTLNDPTKRLSTMGQVESAFTKLKESLISLLPSASKDEFNSNPLEALDSALLSLDAQLATSNSESVELTDDEKETFLNVKDLHKIQRVFKLLGPLMNQAKMMPLKARVNVQNEIHKEIILEIYMDQDKDSEQIHAKFYPKFVQLINRWGGIKPESRPKAEAIERFLRAQGFITQGFLYTRSKKI